MVKLPVIVYNRRSQVDVYGDAIAIRAKLEAQANANRKPADAISALSSCSRRSPATMQTVPHMRNQKHWWTAGFPSVNRYQKQAIGTS